MGDSHFGGPLLVRNEDRDWDFNPMFPDEPADPQMMITKRQLCRLMVTAVEAGARQQRDRHFGDAISWMLHPHPDHDGVPLIGACMDLAHCRSALLHCADDAG